MSGSWFREEQADLAAQKMLDGAAQAFVDLGVSGAGMGEIARYAGCSRGTLYRYFKNRHELHLAFVNDRAMRLVAELHVELQDIRDPARQLCEYLLRAVQKVRNNPAMAVWFEPDESGITARMSRGSEVIASLADAFVSSLPDPPGLSNPSKASKASKASKPSMRQPERGGAPAVDMRGRWMVRVILSLLTMPGDSEQEERALIERFVVPTVLSNDDLSRLEGRA